MVNVENFKWLTIDIDRTIILKVFDGKKFFGVFNISSVMDTTGDELDVKTANIDDLTNMLNLGIVRFVNICDNSDIIDIPFRNLNKLFENGNVLGIEDLDKFITLDGLDTFCVIDDEIRNDLTVYPGLISYPSEDLRKIMKIASLFGSYGMQEKMDALNEITLINHRRIISDKKEKSLR